MKLSGGLESEPRNDAEKEEGKEGKEGAFPVFDCNAAVFLPNSMRVNNS